jgi:16S rRNA G966 N2-methylase RsmD
MLKERYMSGKDFNIEQFASELADCLVKNREALNGVLKGIIEQGIWEYIRDQSDKLIPHVSAEAEKVFDRYKIDPPFTHTRITGLCDKNQDLQALKKELWFEHPCPLKNGAKEVITLAKSKWTNEGETQKAIEAILKQMLSSTWITAEENKLLDDGDKSGKYSQQVDAEYKGKSWKTNRPSNAYALCGITLA